MKKIVGTLLLTAVGAVFGAAFYAYYFQKAPNTIKTVYLKGETAQPSFSYQSPSPRNPSQLPDFSISSELSRPAVVRVKSEILGGDNIFHFFRDREEGSDEYRGRASGSGVLISKDGYIITNNHVIEDADKVEITLIDNREFPAEIVGRDIPTDLALLKIVGEDFSYLEFGNSDETRVGDWVLAVGNPLNLTSTVTAGIISAKGRNLRLLSKDSDFAIESFLQTDAVVNRGNSGGALVDLSGNLIGINTAISSHSGFYAGYSFAIPSSIAKKVMEDLLMFGKVKRGLLGVEIVPVTAEVARRYNLNVLKGAYIDAVRANSGAEDAGIKVGDVVVAVNQFPVSNASELQEQVSKFRPGDFVNITAFRGEETLEFKVSLKAIGESSVESSKRWDGR
ncbi:MAG: trypsin-like peptidase domain-containing protein [Bacteroidota bacterium]